MSRFFSGKYSALTPYVPGEQPRDRKFVKLNTNESPFPPSPKAVQAAELAAKSVQLYSDPSCRALRETAAALYGVKSDNVICTNGSDEILSFAFAAFCDDGNPAVFCDVTYGFYKVFAAFHRVPATVIPLKEDLTADVNALKEARGTLFIANPNAPTGLALGLDDIEALAASDPERAVVIDEAYVDFGGDSAIPLVKRYPNLLVTRTFSKSRSMAGARLGLGIADASLIADLETLRYSTNPYNINSVTLAMGKAALEDEEYTKKNCRTIAENREFLIAKLRELGFFVTDSKANFVFCRHNSLSGEEIYTRLRQRGVLVRHFDEPRIRDFNRITVGSREECGILIKELETVLGGAE